MRSRYHSFLIITILVVTTYSVDTFLITEQLLLDTYSEFISLNKAQELVSSFIKYQWISYVFVPITLLLKWFLVTCLIYSSLYLAALEIKFKALFSIILEAEWVFIAAYVVKFCWFFFFQTNFSFKDLQYFFPLSALNLFTPDELEAWWVYPFQLINAFEVAYWLVLAYLLGKAIHISTGKAFEHVLKGYGSGLLLWVLLVVFITLNYSV